MKYYVLDPDDGKIVGTATKVGDKFLWDHDGSIDGLFKAVYSEKIRASLGGILYIYVVMTDLMQELF